MNKIIKNIFYYLLIFILSIVGIFFVGSTLEYISFLGAILMITPIVFLARIIAQPIVFKESEVKKNSPRTQKLFSKIFLILILLSGLLAVFYILYISLYN